MHRYCEDKSQDPGIYVRDFGHRHCRSALQAAHAGVAVQVKTKWHGHSNACCTDCASTPITRSCSGVRVAFMPTFLCQQAYVAAWAPMYCVGGIEMDWPVSVILQQSQMLGCLGNFDGPHTASNHGD